MSEYTLSIIKPDAVRAGKIGEVLRRFEMNAFRVRALKMIRLSKSDAESFYAVHRDKSFFDSLTNFMSSGPCVVLCLEGEQVITRLRQLAGATDPADAAFGTVRRELGTSTEQNVIHASDSADTARAELAFFFNALEIH